VLEALSFLTVIGRGRTPSAAALPWFPVIGALVGATVGLTYWGASQWWNPLVAGALAVAVDLLVTGMLHLDGLADAADGLLPHMDREHRLAVMATPDVGAFAVGIVSMTLIVRVASAGALHPNNRAVAGLAMVWATSRIVMAVALAHLPYARPGGLAESFRGTLNAVVQGLWIALWVAALGGLAIWDGTARWPAAAAGAALSGGGVLWFSERRIGGFTGDGLGAACVLSETVGLLVASATW
jgi:adenosylcobinamide-GDP ribazoletransferase